MNHSNEIEVASIFSFFFEGCCQICCFPSSDQSHSWSALRVDRAISCSTSLISVTYPTSRRNHSFKWGSFSIFCRKWVSNSFPSGLWDSLDSDLVYPQTVNSADFEPYWVVQYWDRRRLPSVQVSLFCSSSHSKGWTFLTKRVDCTQAFLFWDWLGSWSRFSSYFGSFRIE